MSSIRESIRRLIRGDRDSYGSDPVVVDRFHWTKQVQQWSPERRKRVRSALEEVVRRSDFVPDRTERNYGLQELDQSKHSGASILALRDVLEAFETYTATEKNKNE